jgi:hypothetical protein
MMKWLLGWRLAAFERAYGYDAGYLRELLEADPGALVRFSKLMGMAQYRKGIPPDAWYAAKLVGTLAEDCGPCTQLVVTMAEREGVPPAVLRAVVGGDTTGMPDGVALAFRFARAVLAHDPEADALREQVVGCWGRRGLVSLGFAITTSRLFPTLKYALGHGQSCTRVTVGGTATPVAARQPVA